MTMTLFHTPNGNLDILSCEVQVYLFFKFIYLFLATLGLCCRAWDSHCGGFSCCRARALGAWASVVVACGFQ